MKLVSVIIPCKNEVHHIKNCVRSVLANTYEHIEVLVCDGMSEDGSADVVRSMDDPRVRLVENVQQTTPAAFNAGISNAQGDIVIILNARCTISKNYVSECVKILDATPKIGCVGGLGDHISKTTVQRAIALAMQSKIGVGFGNYRTFKKSKFVDTVWTPAYRKSIFSEIGLFDETLLRNQDEDFNYLVRKAGYKIYMHDGIHVHYEARGSFKKLFMQYLQYGYWKFRVNRKHHAFITARQAIPPAFILFLLSGPAWYYTGFGMSYLYILGIYLLLVLMSAAIKSGNMNEIFLVLFAVILMHISYGYGYIRAVIDSLFGIRQSALFKEINH